MLAKLAFLNLFRNKRRSLSTGLAICVGFVGLNLLGAYIYRIKKALDMTSVYSALRGHVQIYKKDSLVQFTLRPKNYSINLEEKNQILSLLKGYGNDVEYIGQNLSGAGLLSNGVKSHPVIAVSYEPEIYAKSLSQPELMKWAKDWILPSQLANLEVFRSSTDTISITPRISDIMGFKVPLAQNESAQFAGRSFDGDLNAVNVELGAEHTTGLQFLEDSLILVPLTKMQELYSTDAIESISVYLNKHVDIKKFRKKLDHDLAQIGFKADTYFYYDEKINSVYEGTMGFLLVMGGFFVFLIGTAVSLTIINSLTMGIIERTKEIGTLRAVGFTQKHVAQAFILENLILCFFAVISGIVLTSVIALVVNNLNIRFTPPAASGKIQFVLVWNIAIAFAVTGVVFMLTWVSSYFVMKSKSQMKLIDLMNDTGA